MHPVRPAALVLLFAVSASSPSLARSSPWSFTLGGGFVSGYVHQHVAPTRFILGTGPARSASLPPSWVGSVAARHRVSDGLSLQLEGTYLPFDGDFESLQGPTASGTPSGSLAARFVTLGVGPRFTRGTPGWRTRVFVDVAPLVIWSEHESNTERTPSGGSTVREHRSARAFLPGWTLGAGFGGPIGNRLGYQIGVRYLRSFDPDTRPVHDTYFATDLKGLSNFMIGLGVTLAPWPEPGGRSRAGSPT